jgi:stage II sporulation protein M
MEREEDYGIQERREIVPTGTPDREMENKEYAAKEKDLSTADREVKPLSVSGKNSKKAEFTEYVRNLWPYLVVVVLVFFGALLTGYASAANFPSMADTLMKGFSSRFGPLMTMSPLYIVITIFLNNAFISLLSLVLGLALGIFPILIITFNGYFVGMISYLVSQQKGFIFILLALLPHGIIELPMFFLSASIGLRLGHHVFLYLIGRPTELKKESIQGLKFYFRWIMPLLFVAAIIEIFITPLILSLVRGS